MSRRGNGLTADTYAPLVDLAPHLADAMLDALREAGVAAYAAPPDQPSADEDLDRLYVDVDLKHTAEGILRVHLTRLRDAASRGSDGAAADDPPPAPPSSAAGSGPGSGPGSGSGSGSASEDVPAAPDAGGDGSRAEGADSGATPEPPELDEAAIFADLVANFDAEPEGDRVPWPELENIREDEKPPGEGDDRTGRLPRARVIRSADLEDDEDELPPPDDNGHYVPPPPPPLPTADPLTKGAWIALVGGPLYLLITVVLNWDVPGWAAFLAVAAFIGGFVTLVLRMGDEPRPPDDDGAVV
ncbi:hypothetical protein [Actinomadura harenae]|uniref:DUF308 domain-containing protein n=1 Tax=Actinomadura harenae TaxID=2483351 RepID=A0A3M2LZW0_9ACTN|nr:hypothetical protein [Actinomadura harenae]RMI40488.1 hypothetical protein EBO15_26195 [Actinomadura harenae]